MARMNAREFEQQIRELCANSEIVMRVILLTESIDHTQLRIFLTDLSFVDMYYHHLSGKTSYAQIRDGQRIFGADNKKYWHWHPREDSDSHVPSASEITIEEFMKRLGSTLK